MTSRERILNAAIPVFARKGRHGAHMEEIAALAHINKAMIYYIFHNKDELYREVLKFVFNEASMSISRVSDEDIDSGKNYAEVISNFISAQILFFSENRNFTKIMVDAMSSGTEELPVAIKYFKDAHTNNEPSKKLNDFIKKGISDNVIREIDPDHLIINMVGMVMIYFLSDSITQSLDIEIKDEKHFLEDRRNSIIDLVLNSIFINKSIDSETKIKKNKTVKNKA